MADVAASGLSPDLSSYAGYGATNQLIAKATNSPDVANQWLANAQGQQSLQRGQLQLSQQHLQALNGIVSSVMADPSPANAQQRLMDGVRMGVISPQDFQNETSAISQMAAGQQDPSQPNEQIRRYAFQHGQPLLDAMQQTQLAGMGQSQLVNKGNAFVPYASRGGPNPGISPAGGPPIPLQPSPEFQNSKVTYTTPDNVEHQTTNAGFQAAAGASPQPTSPYDGTSSPNSYVDPRRAATAGVTVVNGRPVYGAPPPAPPGIQPGDTIKPAPTGARPGNGPIIAGGGVSGAPQPPGIPGPSPMLGAGLKAYQDDLANASAKMDGVRSLTQALPLVQQLGATGSGPGTAAFQKAKSTLVSLGVLSADTPDVAAYDESRKYLSAYVSKSALAGRSDMGQLQAQASSPNLETSNAATLSLAQNAIAADRMDAARPKAFEKTGTDDLSGYGQFKAGYTQSQDLRAYKLDIMPATERAALIKGMKAKQATPEGRRFWQSLQNAHDAGVLTGLPAAGTDGQ